MTTLYVTQPGAVLRRQSDSLLVTGVTRRNSDGTPKAKPTVFLNVELHRVTRIALATPTHVTKDVIDAAFEFGIPICWLDRDGTLRGRLTPNTQPARAVTLRLAQYARALDPTAALEHARLIVAAKLDSAGAILQRLRRNHPEHRDACADALAAIRTEHDALTTTTTTTTTTTLDQLLGHEGAAARAFFAAWRLCLPQALGFQNRQRRPPPDPVNALLSFTAVLLGNRITSQLIANGFDPTLGALHQPTNTRDSLALDILEEFRHPVVDRFVLRTTNLETLTNEHFAPDDTHGGVRLTRDGQRRFFRAWETFLARPLPAVATDLDASNDAPVMSVINGQIARLRANLLEHTPYAPFRLRP